MFSRQRSWRTVFMNCIVTPTTDEDFDDGAVRGCPAVFDVEGLPRAPLLILRDNRTGGHQRDCPAIPRGLCTRDWRCPSGSGTKGPTSSAMVEFGVAERPHRADPRVHVEPAQRIGPLTIDGVTEGRRRTARSAE